MPRTIMIAAGGTGGHVFPGLAVADTLRASGWRVVWLGAESGMEAVLVAKRGYEMAAVKFSGVRGKGLLALLLLPLKLLLAFWQSARAILAKRPDVVLGMGGYMSFPGGMMAALLGRPLVIHEQNSVAGLANRVLAGVADRVLCAFPDALKGATRTGNPVRPEIAAIAAPKARYARRSGPLRILVVGGSLGAKALNDAVPRALALIPREVILGPPNRTNGWRVGGGLRQLSRPAGTPGNGGSAGCSDISGSPGKPRPRSLRSEFRQPLHAVGESAKWLLRR